MKRIKMYKILFAISALLALVFIVCFGVTVYNYHTRFMGSAPLSAYALVLAVEFIFPSLIFLLIGFIVKRVTFKKSE